MVLLEHNLSEKTGIQKLRMVALFTNFNYKPD